MAANTKTKVDQISIDGNLKETIEAKLADGWVLQNIVNLQPAINKILVIYVKPPQIEPPQPV